MPIPSKLKSLTFHAYDCSGLFFFFVLFCLAFETVKPNQVTVRPVEVATEHIVMNWTFPKEHRALRYRVAYESRSSNAVCLIFVFLFKNQKQVHSVSITYNNSRLTNFN